MDESLNKVVLSLAEAVITLYPADTVGAPVLNSALWTGAMAEGLKVRERWIKAETRPTGAPYPNKHPLTPQYEISMDRVWSLPLWQLSGFQADWTDYVLDIVWTDEDGGQWQRRTFYGVTISEETLNSRSIDAGFTDEQSFDAQYYSKSSGTSTPPAISSSLPYQVLWRGPDGIVPLYSYDAGAQEFTATGDTTNRATIGYDESGAFAVTFAGDDSPVLSTTVNATAYRNSGNYRNGNCYQAAQFKVRGGIFTVAPLELPRLVFYYGNTAVCTVTKDGLYAARFIQKDPATPAGWFGIFAGESLIAALGAGEVDAKNFVI